MLMGEGYRTFPVILYTEFVGEVSQNKGFASAIAVIAIVITTVVFSAQNIASKRNSFSMNSLHPIEEKPLHGAKGVLIHVFCYVVVFIAILPQLYVLYTSFKKTNGTIYVDGYSLDSYREMFSRLGRSVQNTIVIPVIALVAVVLLAVLMAYLSVRRRNVLSSTVDVLSMVPYIIPGTVVGIALVTSFNRPLWHLRAPCSSWSSPSSSAVCPIRFAPQWRFYTRSPSPLRRPPCPSAAQR